MAPEQKMLLFVELRPRHGLGHSDGLARRRSEARIQGKNYDVTPDGKRFLMVESVDSAPPKAVTVILKWMEDVKSRLRSK